MVRLGRELRLKISVSSPSEVGENVSEAKRGCKQMVLESFILALLEEDTPPVSAGDVAELQAQGGPACRKWHRKRRGQGARVLFEKATQGSLVLNAFPGLRLQMAAGQEWVPHMEPWYVETWTKTCGLVV